MDLLAGEEQQASLAGETNGTRNGQIRNENGAEQASGEENKFQSAISAWRSMPIFSSLADYMLTAIAADIDLTKLIPELDGVANDIVSHQRDSVVSRKDLAQKTKDFRKLEDAAKLVEVKSLLKCMYRLNLIEAQPNSM